MDSTQRVIHELFNTTSLVNKDGSSWKSSLKNSGAKIVALYFSAHWCPPCRQFTPILKSVYEAYKNSNMNSKLSIVFVSGDRSQSEMTAYMKEAHGTGLNSCYTVTPSCSIRGNGKCTQPNNGIEKGFFTLEKRDE